MVGMNNLTKIILSCLLGVAAASCRAPIQESPELLKPKPIPYQPQELPKIESVKFELYELPEELKVKHDSDSDKAKDYKNN